MKRKELLEKLRLKKNNLKTSRSTGASPQMQKAMKLMNENGTDDPETMQDLQNDMKGLKANKAKKLMKTMMKGMDEKEIENVSKLVKQKVPESSSGINNLLAQQKKLLSKTEETKQQQQHSKIYTPASQLTPDELEQRRIGNKKRKSFAPIQIHVPKITDLHTLQNETPKQITQITQFKPTGNINVDMDRLFSKPKQFVSLQTRLLNLSKFKAKRAENHLQSCILMATNDLVMKTIVHVQLVYHPIDYLIIPNTEMIMIDANPDEFTKEYVPSSDGYCYKVNEKNQVVRTKNELPGAHQYWKKYEKVWNWITSLVNKSIPWDGFIEYLNGLGIVLKEDGIFFLQCQEYTNKETVSVCEIPYFKLI